MTRRERKEARLQKRLDWAETRDSKAAGAFEGARQSVAGIPFGQPILVGHHSERRHRAAIKRHDQRMRAGCDSTEMAERHRSKADGIARQLETSIFSDDADALERLAEKIADLEQIRGALLRMVSKCTGKGPVGECPILDTLNQR